MESQTNDEEANKPHLLMVPFPSQGHIIPMFKLAKLLHHRGFHITFLNNDFNHHRLLRSHGISSLEGLIPNFDFASIPDGLPPSDDNTTQNIHDIMYAIRTFMSDKFVDFLNGLNNLTSSSHRPPLTFIIVDAFMSFVFDVADKFIIPTVQFVILGTASILPWYSTKDLIQNGFLPLKDVNGFTNGCLDKVINFIPGLEGMPLKYISDMLLVKDLSDNTFSNVIEVCDKSIRGGSSAILFNTFEDLEFVSIKQLSSLYSKPVLGIGPIHLLEEKFLDNGLYSFGANLWEEDESCLKWLDSKPPGSVLFVSFGSITYFTAQQMIELAWGLANSKHNFLWVIRSDLLRGGDGKSNILSSEFDMEIKDRAFLTGWCPQEKVLKHRAIGGFMTQCGWNSLLENVCGGLPVLCLPFFAEQRTNTWLCCNKWGIGLESDINNIKREELEMLIKELMSGLKSQELKRNAIEWKKKAEEACESGSSVANFEKLVKTLGSFKKFNV